MFKMERTLIFLFIAQSGIAATECELEFIAYPVGCEGTFSVAPYRKVADNACSGGVQRASEAVETHACPASFECACVHGQCTSGECATQCTCDKGFYGPTCAVAANVCAELCKHGTCITIDHCANCESGWTVRNEARARASFFIRTFLIIILIILMLCSPSAFHLCAQGAWCDAVEQPFQVASDSEGHMSAAAGAVLALFIVLVLCVCGGGIGYYAWSRHYKVVHV